MRILTFLIVLSSILFIASCSDSDGPTRFTQLSEELESNELRLIFSPTVDQPELNLKVDGYGSSQLFVNWGDDDLVHIVPYGDMSHIYKEVDRDYTISIKSAKEQYITGFSIDDSESAARIKSMRAGECPNLTNFSMYILNNMLERFDLSKNPQFYDTPILLYIHTSNFYFKDFESFKNINFYINLPISVSLENMSASYLRIFYTLDYSTPNSIVPSINLTNSNIDKLEIMSYVRNGQEYLSIDNLNLTGVNSNLLYLLGVRVTNDCNFYKMKYCETLRLYSFDCFGKVHFSDSHKYIDFNNSWLPRKLSEIEVIDVRNCTELVGLQVRDTNSVKTIEYNKTDKLEYVRIVGNDYLENYEYNNDLIDKAQIKTTAAIDQNPILSLNVIP